MLNLTRMQQQMLVPFAGTELLSKQTLDGTLVLEAFEVAILEHAR